MLSPQAEQCGVRSHLLAAAGEDADIDWPAQAEVGGHEFALPDRDRFRCWVAVDQVDDHPVRFVGWPRPAEHGQAFGVGPVIGDRARGDTAGLSAVTAFGSGDELFLHVLACAFSRRRFGDLVSGSPRIV